MFKKVLIAEDHEIANVSVQKTLDELGVQEAKYVYYCDDALNWIKTAIRDKAPYDLLITDLVFDDDYTPQKINHGLDLIDEAKILLPHLKVIVLSAESRPVLIEDMFKHKQIDAYVRKGRRDAQYLKEALDAVYNNKNYQSPEYKRTMQESNTHEFLTLDIAIVSLLSKGILQKNIPEYLKEENIKPNGLSSVEKRLGKMKETLGFLTNEQLIAYCKDIGLI